MELIFLLIAILVIILAGLIASAILFLAFRAWWRVQDWLLGHGIIRQSRATFNHEFDNGVCVNCGGVSIYERCNDYGHRLEGSFCVKCGIHGSALRMKIRKCAGKKAVTAPLGKTSTFGSSPKNCSFDQKRSVSSEVIDIRTDLERSVERDAHRNISKSPEVDNLIERLITIGKGERFITSEKTAVYNERLRHIVAREIGARLFELGGHELMLFAWYRVGAVLGPTSKGDLEYAWDGVGDWSA